MTDNTNPNIAVDPPPILRIPPVANGFIAEEESHSSNMIHERHVFNDPDALADHVKKVYSRNTP